jgi:hypothetical protein
MSAPEHGQARGKNQICGTNGNADSMLQEETMQFKRCTLEIDGPVAVLRMRPTKFAGK